MARGRRSPSQGWKTFLDNHADGIASMDLFVVPTISFRLLYGLLILHHDRRQILWLGVTAHPTAEWISRQLTEAYGWNAARRYIIRDRDAVCGDVFIRRLRAMGIRDRPTAPRSPWQNGYCERAIGSIRRKCLAITRCEHIYPWRRMRQYRALLRGQGTSIVDLYWAGCIINMSGFDLRQAQLFAGHGKGSRACGSARSRIQP